jgi:hypothetical protein
MMAKSAVNKLGACHIHQVEGRGGGGGERERKREKERERERDFVLSTSDEVKKCTGFC